MTGWHLSPEAWQLIPRMTCFGWVAVLSLLMRKLGLRGANPQSREGELGRLPAGRAVPGPLPLP